MSTYKGIQAVAMPSKEAWRSWLEMYHTTERSVWLIIYKKASGISTVYYNEAVDEALCFGWVDSKINKRDEVSYYQFFSVRDPSSNWSKVNKDKVAQLVKSGRMAEAGLIVVELAKKNGAWDALNEVEELVLPADLASAFGKSKVALENWNGFPRSVKRGILEFLLNAKKLETREARIQAIVSSAEKNIRLGFQRSI